MQHAQIKYSNNVNIKQQYELGKDCESSRIVFKSPGCKCPWLVESCVSHKIVSGGFFLITHSLCYVWGGAPGQVCARLGGHHSIPITINYTTTPLDEQHQEELLQKVTGGVNPAALCFFSTPASTFSFLLVFGSF